MNKKRPLIYRFFIGYAGLLLLSWFIWWAFPQQEEPDLYYQEGEEGISGYYDIPGPDDAAVLMIYPDSYKGASLLMPLAERLSEEFRVIIPEYSVAESATDENYTPSYRALQGRELMNQLGIERIYLGGYGYGGSVAVNHSAVDPDRVSVLFMMASPGIQQMHFLGNHGINRTLYALLYPVYYSFQYLTPHAGWAENHPFDIHYIRSMRAMDLRDSEGKLRALQIPVSIIHPEEDRHTPLTVAREVYRIVPQSTISVVEGGYNSVNERYIEWADIMASRIHEKERGDAKTLEEAETERLEYAEKPFDADETDTIQGLTLLILMSLLLMAVLVNEDFGSITAGLLVATGIIDFQFAMITCFVGILLSDVIAYSVGRSLGLNVLKVAPFKWVVRKRDLERAEEMFEMRGAQIIFITRFVPGTRIPTYMAAGILKTKFLTFLGYFAMAIAIWVPFIVGLSSLIGQPMLGYLEVYQDYAIWIVIAFFALVYAILKYALPLTTVKGRRQLYVRLVRLKERISNSG
ncbi:MAG: VTT domain-containing protein [Balneolaceae bacterium]|nr:VTT domain-containing protein [Balneolaceae bacterium]MCH8547324.1 VTT domain-containing protein [Balneolaceae bacterium]